MNPHDIQVHSLLQFASNDPSESSLVTVCRSSTGIIGKLTAHLLGSSIELRRTR